jgi:hypothetical protein
MYAFSLPTKSDKVPSGAEWIHEIKYDGYRMLVIPITTAPADQANSDTINASLKLMQQSQETLERAERLLRRDDPFLVSAKQK